MIVPRINFNALAVLASPNPTCVMAFLIALIMMMKKIAVKISIKLFWGYLKSIKNFQTSENAKMKRNSSSVVMVAAYQKN
jgi:hypothetical protein